MAETKIEWAERVWNPTVGCRRVSAGCQNCYAERFARRLAAIGRPEYQGLLTDDGRWNGTVRTLPERLNDPLRWRKPARIFVDSMSDLFHENVPVSFIAAVFETMASWRLICRKQNCDHGPECYEDPGHTYLILTKRPGRMKSILTDELPEYVANYYPGDSALSSAMEAGEWPLKNVWLGSSAENQAAADERIPLLLGTPAIVRFVSCEPLLGPVELHNLRYGDGWHWDALTGFQWKDSFLDHQSGTAKLDWVIVGGESGPGARPMHPEWVRTIRDQCQGVGIPFFFKQWGTWTPEDVAGKRVAVSRRDGAIGDHWGVYRFRSGAYARAESRDDTAFMVRVGKHRAGRILDGREWEQYPETGS